MRGHPGKPSRMIGIVGRVANGIVMGDAGPLGQEDAVALDLEHCLVAVEHCGGSASGCAPREMGVGQTAVREFDPNIREVVDGGATRRIEDGGNAGRSHTPHQPMYQVEDVPSVVDENAAARARVETPSLAAVGGHASGAGGLAAKPHE